MSGHLPLRPSWDCGACGKPWPCAPAREQLAGEKDAAVLPIYMAAQLNDAAAELAAPPGELFERFVAWTRSTPEAPVVGQAPAGKRDRAREHLAEALGWPDGALNACVDLEERFPGWDVMYVRANKMKGFERPAGYRAVRLLQQIEVFATAPEELAVRIEQARPAWEWRPLRSLRQP